MGRLGDSVLGWVGPEPRREDNEMTPFPPVRMVAIFAVMLVLAVSGCSSGPASTASRAHMADSDPPTRLTVKAPDVESCTTLPLDRSVQDVTGDRLPNMGLSCLISGPAVNVQQLSGRPVVVNLWATWCGPCREEMPILQAARARYGRAVAFLGVDTRDDPARAAAFLNELEVTYPQVSDPTGQLLSQLRVPGLPVTVVLDSQGRISGRHIGAVDKDTLSALVKDAEQAG